MRPKARVEEIIVQEVEKELLVYDLKTHTAMALNETSAKVWLLSDGKRTVPEIAQALSEKSGSPATDELVEFALGQLSEKDLLEPARNMPRVPDGTSRREALRQIALATSIALPAIASIVAPTAASAQSANCTACVKFNQGGVCGACVNVVGTCYDNAGCGGGQATPGVTCGNCAAGVGSCAGGPGTCSWRQV